MMGVDSIAEAIKSVNKDIKISALVDSGFFADYSSGLKEYDNTEPSSRKFMESHGIFDPVNPHTMTLDYSYGMRNVFKMMNMSGGIDADCIEANKGKNGGDDCMFGSHLGLHVQTPMYILQSKYDSWQIKHVVGKSKDLITMNEFGKLILRDVEKVVGSVDMKNTEGMLHGGFVDSCTHHCAGCQADIWRYSYPNSLMSAADGFSRWLEQHSTINGVSVSSGYEKEIRSNSSLSFLTVQDQLYPCEKCCGTCKLLPRSTTLPP